MTSFEWIWYSKTWYYYFNKNYVELDIHFKLLLTVSNCNLGINWPRFFQNCPNEVRAIWKNQGQFISPNCILSQLISVLLITIVQDFSIFRYFLSIILLHRSPRLSIPVSSKARRLVCLVSHPSKLFYLNSLPRSYELIFWFAK